MIEPVNIDSLVERLSACLADLDRLGAHIPAAYVDAALHALDRRHEPLRYVSEME